MRKQKSIPSGWLVLPVKLASLLMIVFIILLAGCAGEEPAAGDNSLGLTSPAFAAGQAIPQVYTCQGEDRSPPLAWSAPPEGTLSLALVMDDPDAPVGTWVHWVVMNIPPEGTGLGEGAAQAVAVGSGADEAGGAAGGLPGEAVQGKNSWGRADYGGPCPPSGEHRYFFRLYALDIVLPEGEDPLDKAGLLKAIEGHILAQGELMGVYQKQ